MKPPSPQIIVLVIVIALLSMACESGCLEDPAFENSKLRQSFGFPLLPSSFKYINKTGQSQAGIPESGNRYYARDTQRIEPGTHYFARSLHYQSCRVVYEENFFLRRSIQQPDSVMSIGISKEPKGVNPWDIRLLQEGIPSDFATLVEIYYRWGIQYPALRNWVVWLRKTDFHRYQQVFRKKSLEERTWEYFNQLHLIPEGFTPPTK